MFKKIMIAFLVLLVSSGSVYAGSKGLNIFAFPREVPADKIYHDVNKPIDLKHFKGKFTLVVFWSKHCVPCIKELDNLNNFVKQTKYDGIQVIIVSKDDEWMSLEEQSEFLAKFKAPDLEFYLDPKGKLAEDFGIFASPHTVLVNKSSEEIGRISGSVEWDDEDVIEYIYKIKAQHG